MSSKNLVICDPDSEYAARLAVYFSGKRELAFQVKTCSCPQQIQPILEKGTIDFLMLAEEFYEPYPDEVVKTSGKLILLSSEKGKSVPIPVRQFLNISRRKIFLQSFCKYARKKSRRIF